MAEGGDDSSSRWRALGASTGTLAGVIAFVVGGVGTIVAAMGDFGSDDSAIAAARRNHVWWLVAAASLAALGLLCGALYTLLQSSSEGGEGAADSDEPVETPGRKSRTAGGRRLAPWVLAVGVLAIALGVGLGAYATTNRQPGRPTIKISRVPDAQAVVVHITAEGLSSDAWYELRIDGFPDAFDRNHSSIELVAARFSPGQDGKLDWSETIGTTDLERTKIARVLVRVAPGAIARNRGLNCDVNDKVTCDFVRVPSLAEPTAPKGD
jgi:hypothetical protein